MRAILAIAGVTVAAIAVAILIAFMRPNTSSVPLEEAEKTSSHAKPAPSNLVAFDAAKDGSVRATMVIDGKGTMELELYPKAAPKTVEQFTRLCKQHFYDGVLVHRKAADPSIFQTGDPESRSLDPARLRGKTTDEVTAEFHLGRQGSGSTVPLEAKLPNTAFSIGLARGSDPNSGDSQFYVNLNDNSALDGQYCVFGRVMRGQDVAGKVEIGDRIQRLSVP